MRAQRGAQYTTYPYHQVSYMLIIVVDHDQAPNKPDRWREIARASTQELFSFQKAELRERVETRHACIFYSLIHTGSMDMEHDRIYRGCVVIIYML